MNVAQDYHKTHELLSAGRDAKLGRLLHRIDRVTPGIGEADNLRLGRGSLQQERREVLRVQRNAHLAKHSTTILLHDAGEIGGHLMAEGIIGRQDETTLAALPHDRARSSDRLGVSIKRPMKSGGRTPVSYT